MAKDELLVWEGIFYTGLEACVPLDEENTLDDLTKSCNVPKVPFIFDSRLTNEATDAKLAMINAQVLLSRNIVIAAASIFGREFILVWGFSRS